MTGLDFNPRDLVLLFIDAYRYILLGYIILSILQSLAGLRLPDGLRPPANFVYDLSEPFLRIFRGLLPALRMGGMGLDLSPMIAFIVLGWVIRPIAESVIPA